MAKYRDARGLIPDLQAQDDPVTKQADPDDRQPVMNADGLTSPVPRGVNRIRRQLGGNGHAIFRQMAQAPGRQHRPQMRPNATWGSGNCAQWRHDTDKRPASRSLPRYGHTGFHLPGHQTLSLLDVPT